MKGDHEHPVTKLHHTLALQRATILRPPGYGATEPSSAVQDAPGLVHGSAIDFDFDMVPFPASCFRKVEAGRKNRRHIRIQGKRKVSGGRTGDSSNVLEFAAVGTKIKRGRGAECFKMTEVLDEIDFAFAGRGRGIYAYTPGKVPPTVSAQNPPHPARV